MEGHIQTRSWEKDGETKYRTEIVAERVQFGPRGASDSGGEAPQVEGPKDDINPDDIPF